MERAWKLKRPGRDWPGEGYLLPGGSRLRAALALRAGRARQEGTLRHPGKALLLVQPCPLLAPVQPNRTLLPGSGPASHPDGKGSRGRASWTSGPGGDGWGRHGHVPEDLGPAS